jgi:tRNA A-37 threonylcarbamoyl transferase component Bud32
MIGPSRSGVAVKLCPACRVENPPDSRFCQNCGAAIFDVGAAPADPYLGRIFQQKFLIQSVLGQGAMGRVYLAEHVALGKAVCIKILHPHLSGDESLARRFHREARAASKLSHPNSIAIIDFGQAEDGTLFIAMEYLPGRDLRRVIREEFPIPPQRIVKILGQVLSALEEAHAQGVIHRDLKPENIMISETRTEKDLVKVLDFGIAKIQEPGPEGGTLTVAGLVCGTPEYMAPEQARGDPLDARVDLYAVGVILYQMLTGELPFKAESALATVTKHLTEEPIPPRERRPDLTIDPELEAICLQAMSKDREKRFASAATMKAALEAAGTGVRPPGVVAAAPAAAPAGDGSRWTVGALPSAEPGGPSSTQTPMAFAVEEAPPQRERRAGSVAAWVSALAIVLLGGAAVAMWKLEIGPFATVAETPVAAAQPPAAAATPGLATKVEAPRIEPPKPEPPRGAPPKLEPPRAEPAKEPKAAAREEKESPPRPRPVREDPEAALKAALAAAAASRPPPPPSPAAAEGSQPAQPRPQAPMKQPAPQPRGEALPPPDPIKAQRFYEEGLRLLSANRVREAVQKLKDAVRYNPTSPEFHRDLGKAHFRAGNRRHGVWHYRKYLELWPDAPDSAIIRKVVGTAAP